MTFEKMKVRIHNYHIPKNLSADGLDDRIMLSHSARQNKGSMVQVFTQKDRHIIYSSSNIPTYIYACIYIGILPIVLRSGERFLNEAPATLRFDQWKHFSAE